MIWNATQNDFKYGKIFAFYKLPFYSFWNLQMLLKSFYPVKAFCFYITCSYKECFFFTSSFLCEYIFLLLPTYSSEKPQGAELEESQRYQYGGECALLFKEAVLLWTPSPIILSLRITHNHSSQTFVTVKKKRKYKCA